MLIFVPQPRLVAGLQAKGELGQSFFAMSFVLFSSKFERKCPKHSCFRGLVLGKVTLGLGLGLVLRARGVFANFAKAPLYLGVFVPVVGLQPNGKRNNSSQSWGLWAFLFVKRARFEQE